MPVREGFPEDLMDTTVHTNNVKLLDDNWFVSTYVCIIIILFIQTCGYVLYGSYYN